MAVSVQELLQWRVLRDILFHEDPRPMERLLDTHAPIELQAQMALCLGQVLQFWPLKVHYFFNLL